jgi:hypothetical protein
MPTLQIASVKQTQRQFYPDRPRDLAPKAVRVSTFLAFNRHDPVQGRMPIYARSELAKILKGLFGRAWWYVGPSVLKVSGRHLSELSACLPYRKDMPTLAQIRRVERWASKLPGMLEEWRLESIAVVEAEAERRRGEMSDAVTRLKGLRIARERLDAERVAKRKAAAVQRAAERAAGLAVKGSGARRRRRLPDRAE